MNCNDVAAILDDHRGARLSAAERSAVDLHLCSCTDCAAAWHAQNELLALQVPAAPALLHDTVLAAITGLVASRPQPRRSLGPIVIGSALLAGAALAAVTFVTVTRAPDAAVPASAAAPFAAPSAPAADAQLPVADAASAEADERPTSVELVETGLDMVPLVRHSPKYPPEALAQRVEGHVQVKFDVTAAGVVENVSVVESSDERFEPSAIEALATWRYLPRIASGKRVRSDGIRTIVQFALGGDPQPPDPRREQEVNEAVREFATFSAGLEIALDRLAADDLRGAELQLDEMQAVYGTERDDLWNFYGYLYTVQSRYDRAIDAYETAVAIGARSDFPRSGPFVQLANLYFARHQYDMALKTLLRSNLPGGNRLMSPAANALMQKLNALGVTEETL